MAEENKTLFVFNKALFDEIVRHGHHEKHIVEYVETRLRDREYAEYCYSQGMRTGHGVRPSPCRTDAFIKAEERLMTEYIKRMNSLGVKLYDLDKRDYPNNRGDYFRSRQVYKCWVCGAISNCIVMGGYPGYGVRIVCPSSDCRWHSNLEDKLRWLQNPHPAEYKQALEREIEEFRKQHADKVENDIEGKPDLTPRGGMTNTRSFILTRE